MNRFEFQKLAEIRIHEAQQLLKLGLSSGAYYLAGYAVECALKACIAKETKEFSYPPRNTNSYYSHNLNDLKNLAKLSDAYEQACVTHKNLKAYWQTVQEWSEQVRYEERSLVEAEELIEAIINPIDGVLRWVKIYW